MQILWDTCLQAQKDLCVCIHKAFLCTWTWVLQGNNFCKNVYLASLYWKKSKNSSGFNIDFRHCHRFSIIALFFAYFSCSSGIVQQEDKARINTQESEGWTTPVALHWTCISHGNHPPALKISLRNTSIWPQKKVQRYSSQQASGISCIPSSHFPHSKRRNTQHPWNMLSSCGEWAGTFLSSTNRRSGHTADRWILITEQQHRHGAPFPHGALFPSQNWTASGWV